MTWRAVIKVRVWLSSSRMREAFPSSGSVSALCAPESRLCLVTCSLWHGGGSWVWALTQHSEISPWGKVVLLCSQRTGVFQNPRPCSRAASGGDGGRSWGGPGCGDMAGPPWPLLQRGWSRAFHRGTECSTGLLLLFLPQNKPWGTCLFPGHVQHAWNHSSFVIGGICALHRSAEPAWGNSFNPVGRSLTGKAVTLAAWG